ncbi:sigma 54-interacting transcriptional regulator [uncultured Chitinophaga sp.]|uniref:sigma 54-interacting transcriptional regulator n=1 Tax=uncultured Chitinophaga sp. TaxID=339340 RepID=UPI0025F96973|nr:sigma 54-interacting transcriptional regulator [uncultured Chitinophaga sp.]
MSRSILIVEDEFIVANDVRLILVQAGYQVMGIAASAEEAEEYLLKRKPDLVILDIRLEGAVTGIDFARKLKAENIAFVYLSANSNQKVLEEAKTTEPYGFLVKPFREQDMLVTLDIAWYRHTHSLESKLRQEEQLQKQLTAISNEHSDAPVKLEKVVRAMQPFIPFDYMSTGLRPPDGEHLSDIGYLRIGFNEYQFVGENELLTITGLTKQHLASVTHNTPTVNQPVMLNVDAVAKGSLQQLMSDQFSMLSCLLFPVSLGYGLSVLYSFYSRQPGAYTNDHLVLLGRLKPALEELVGKETYYSTTAGPVKNHPVTSRRSTTDNAKSSGFNGVIGNHPLFLAALDLASQVANYSTSVLILGESGTGKERVAQSIHQFSPRKQGPYIKVNCAAIPPTLIESELFGHEKGAFTGAIEKRKGKFELAHGGTIFLDEIGELPLPMQVKLLRVLQEREIEYVGGRSPVKIDVRVVAATHRNLEKEVAEGNFRLDLYYRLNVFPITLPPLRERKSDIEALSLFFANRFCQSFNKPFNGIATSMLGTLNDYDWPGNIRELENIIEQSVVLNDGKSPLQLARKLQPATPQLNTGPANTIDEIKHMHRETERDYIVSILKKTKGRIRGNDGAAELMKIKPTTLESKMVKLNIKRQDFFEAGEGFNSQ